MSKTQFFEKKLLSTVISGNDPNIEDKRKDVLKELVKIIPQKLFRYRPCNESTFDALLKDRIYFNTPINFNDPYDCVPYVNNNELQQAYDKYKEEEFSSLKTLCNLPQQIQIAGLPNINKELERSSQRLHQIPKEFINETLSSCPNLLDNVIEIMRNLINEIQEFLYEIYTYKTYIACFSEKVDSMLMWSHYSDYHKGFAIEYDSRNLEAKCINCQKQCDYTHMLNLYPILYKKERFDITWMIIEMMCNTLMSRISEERIPFIIPDIFLNIKANTIKYIGWKYEKEWRLFYDCKNPKQGGNFEEILPKAVYLGCKISDINKRIILDIVKEKNIPIYQMELKMDNNKFKLNYKKSQTNNSPCPHPQ